MKKVTPSSQILKIVGATLQLDQSLTPILVNTKIYLNCANYWCDKLSYRLEEVCDLRGGGVSKKIVIREFLQKARKNYGTVLIKYTIFWGGSTKITVG